MFRQRKRTREKGVNLFFATDLHGSDHCFRKFLNTPTVYGANVLILGGDITGKLAVPILREDRALQVHGPGGPYAVEPERLDQTVSQMDRAGFYPFLIEDRDELDTYREDPARVEDKLESLMRDRLERWEAWADEKLAEGEVEILVAPGNDDPEAIDEILRELPHFRLVEAQVIDDAIPGLPLELLSTGVSNPTPWKTHREVEEPELKSKLEEMAREVQDPDKAIFNIHVPPFRSTLDEGPVVDEDTFKATSGFGQEVTIPVGSTAVKEILEEYQPLLSLHGHIHESRGITRIGRTVAINPGSDYSDGVLRGAFLSFSDGGLETYQLTTG